MPRALNRAVDHLAAIEWTSGVAADGRHRVQRLAEADYYDVRVVHVDSDRFAVDELGDCACRVPTVFGDEGYLDVDTGAPDVREMSAEVAGDGQHTDAEHPERRTADVMALPSCGPRRVFDGDPDGVGGEVHDTHPARGSVGVAPVGQAGRGRG